MHISGYTFTRHALHRILDMALDGDEVRTCLERPWRIADSTQDDRRLYFSDRITCVVSQSGEVVTVLWRTLDAWKTDLDAGEYAGRVSRQGEW